MFSLNPKQRLALLLQFASVSLILVASNVWAYGVPGGECTGQGEFDCTEGCGPWPGHAPSGALVLGLECDNGTFVVSDDIGANGNTWWDEYSGNCSAQQNACNAWMSNR